MRYCTVPGCSRPLTRHSRFRNHCEIHHSRQRRHGHPEQRGILVSDLTYYKKLVRSRIAKNKTSDLWTQLADRWRLLTDQCQARMDSWNSGKAQSTTEVRAAYELLKVGQHVELRPILETVLALYLLQDADPRRFRSDEAFLFQLVRRIRGLTHVNAGEYHDHISGKTKRVYRDLPPRVVRSIGHLLAHVFGLAGVYFAQLERKDEEADRKAKETYAQALVALH